MKLIKQIIIFIVFTGAIYGVFTFVTGGKPINDLSALYGSNVDDLNTSISQGWAERSDWDNDLYNSQLVMIAQSHNADLITDEARKSLTDRVNKEAYTTIVNAMNREFAKANCNDNLLQLNYDGLQTVMARQPGVEKLPEIALVDRVYSLYRRIKAFNSRPVALTPRLDSDALSWSPKFEPYSQSILRQKSEMLGNPLYSAHLANITDLKQIHRTETKLAEARTAFYNNLYAQIERYYSDRLNGDIETEILKKLRTNFNTLRSAVFNEIGTRHDISSKLRQLYERLF